MLAPRLSAKAVYTPHGGALHYSFATFRGAIYLTLERLLKRRTDGIIFESGYARQSYLQNVGPLGCPHRIIYNGLRESEFERISPDLPQYDFIFIGEPRIVTRLAGLRDVGLGYLSLGQPLSTLSGGEHQRLRLAAALDESASGVLYAVARGLISAKASRIPVSPSPR